jgi:hypothetical protein
MAAMMVVKVAIHQIVYMVPVGYCLMATVRSVNMLLTVAGTLVGRSAMLGIRRAHLNAMIVHMIAVLMVKVAIVQVICVTVMFYGLMTAIGTMGMVAMVAGMLMMLLRHFSVLSPSGFGPSRRKNAALIKRLIRIYILRLNKFRPSPPSFCARYDHSSADSLRAVIIAVSGLPFSCNWRRRSRTARCDRTRGGRPRIGGCQGELA